MRFFQLLAEGGQTWAHRVRMVKQVLKMTLCLSICGAALYVIYATSQLNPDLLKSYCYYLKAEFHSYTGVNYVNVDPVFLERLSPSKKFDNHHPISIKHLKKLIAPRITEFHARMTHIIGIACRVGIVIFSSLVLFFLVRGAALKRKKHTSGKKKRSSWLLSFQIRFTKKASLFHIAKLPLIKGSETQHILVTGGTGSGKTNCFHHFLPQIKNQKALIIDTSGIFVERYYEPSHDLLLNPFDQRGKPWHPWTECQNSFDFDNLSESMIPQSHHDHENYWRTAARSLLSSLLQKLSDTKKTSELKRWMLYEPLDRLSEFIQDTKAAAHIDPHSEKTAASIRSVAASFLGFLESLQDTEDPFSIKKWIEDPRPNRLFLHAKPSQRATLNPLIACWFSVAVRSLIQMQPNLSRRIWFIIDELPTLQRLKDLESLISEGRKYGGCALISLQSPAQLEDIYGRCSSKTIFGNCATRIIFAEHDAETAEKISKTLGECEVQECQEGISYGAHEVRDGVNLSLQTKRIPLVSPTEIQSLKNNQAFIKLPGNLPITKIQFKKIKK